ncbi:Ubiquinone biosynthesis protein [Savitreella phatthalungensis]
MLRSIVFARSVSTQTGSSTTMRMPRRHEGAYPEHIPLTLPERLLTLAGSGLISLVNPRRGDLVGVTTELTSQPFFLPRLRDAMLRDPIGRRILRDRPRITSTTLSLDSLRQLSDNTVGRVYARWLDAEGVTPDTRLQTRYIDSTFSRPPLRHGKRDTAGMRKLGARERDAAKDAGVDADVGRRGDADELAYVMQRYRECHDFYHAVTGLPIIVEGEIALKWFEWANMGLPVALLSGAGGMLPLRYAATVAPLFKTAIKAVAPVEGLLGFAGSGNQEDVVNDGESRRTARQAERKRQALARLRKVYIPWALREGACAKPLINVYWEEELHTDAEELRRRLGFSNPPDLRRKQEWWDAHS